MRVFSLARAGERHVPIEVEVMLQQGLPQIIFSGLPDAGVKESLVRVKSAIKAAGIELPRSQQILVNLKPAHLKKVSKGVELAIAMAILNAMGAAASLSFAADQVVYFYGELGLDGQVSTPMDINGLEVPEENALVVGAETLLLRNSLQLKNLRHFLSMTSEDGLRWKDFIKRPEHFSAVQLTAEQAQLLKAVVMGGHSVLLAGPAGSGKSFFVELAHSLLPPPKEFPGHLLSLEEIRKGQERVWHPFLKPHTSITVQGMVGGGGAGNLSVGELGRAHGGALLLDEVLEFKPQVIEALRGPSETGRVRIVRSGEQMDYPCEFIMLATTNLCPCGDFVPGKPVSCRYSLTKCRSYGEKLSGPMVDRFQILSFTDQWNKKRSHSWPELVGEVEELHAKYPEILTKAPARYTEEEVLQDGIEPLALSIIQSLFLSTRRRLNTLRVAKTLAFLNNRRVIKERDINAALEWTYRPFERLRFWH